MRKVFLSAIVAILSLVLVVQVAMASTQCRSFDSKEATLAWVNLDPSTRWYSPRENYDSGDAGSLYGLGCSSIPVAPIKPVVPRPQ